MTNQITYIIHFIKNTLLGSAEKLKKLSPTSERSSIYRIQEIRIMDCIILI